MDPYATSKVHVSAFFTQVLEKYELKERYWQARLRVLWPKVVGTAMAQHTFSLHLHKDILHVALSSALLREALKSEQDTLLDRLNEALEEKVLTRIILK